MEYLHTLLHEAGDSPQSKKIGDVPSYYVSWLIRVFPRAQNGWNLEVSLPQEKASAWDEEIRIRMKLGFISPVPLEKLIGKIGFAKTNLFGEFARTQLRPLYRKLYAASFFPKLSLAELRLFHWRSVILLELRPRIPRGVGRMPDFIFYTDAAAKSNTMDSPAIRRQAGDPFIFKLCVSTVPKFWRNHFHQRNIILGSEMVAPHSFPVDLPSYFPWKAGKPLHRQQPRSQFPH